MKLLQYNILMGGGKDAERRSGILDWLRQQGADIVALNELNGWESDMASLARSAGYAYATLHEAQGRSCNVGVMTRKPHKVLYRENAPFHFGLLGIEYEGCTFLITHLMPHSSAYRLGETQRITELIAQTAGPVVLVGDLNTLSPLDRAEVEQPDALEILRSTPQLTSKFLDAEGRPDYAPMETLTGAGLTDLGAGVPDCHTVPTASNKDAAHALSLRIDYMMANAAFLEAWHSTVRVLRSSETDVLSDHYPVLCELTPAKT